jgi:hypothetical protein
MFEGIEPHWIWLAVGIALVTAEMVVPGVYLIWLGMAAILTAGLAFAAPVGIEIQVVTFAILSILGAFAGRNWLRDNPIVGADPLMNRRGHRLVGEVVRVTQAIEDGSGRVHQGDSEWIARGPDAPVGAKMRITGSDGAILLVEPLEAPKDAGTPALPES